MNKVETILSNLKFIHDLILKINIKIIEKLSSKYHTFKEAGLSFPKIFKYQHRNIVSLGLGAGKFFYIFFYNL